MIERKLYTKKAKLFYELIDLVDKGRKLTYYDGIWTVNMTDNDYFINYLEWIRKNSYIEYVSEYEYIRKNKLMNKWTINDIKNEINKINKVVTKYEKMNDCQRKILAASERINHCNNLIIKYENMLKQCEDEERRIIYMNTITNCKETINKMNEILVKIA